MKQFNSKLTPFLTFPGNAQTVCNFYVDLFPDAALTDIVYYDDSSIGEVGKILNATLTIANQSIMVMDLAKEYSTPFSWSFSLLYECDSVEQYDHLFNELEIDGTVMMSEENMQSQSISFRKVCWVTDRFGLTWQLIVK